MITARRRLEKALGSLVTTAHTWRDVGTLLAPRHLLRVQFDGQLGTSSVRDDHLPDFNRQVADDAVKRHLAVQPLCRREIADTNGLFAEVDRKGVIRRRPRTSPTDRLRPQMRTEPPPKRT